MTFPTSIKLIHGPPLLPVCYAPHAGDRMAQEELAALIAQLTNELKDEELSILDVLGSGGEARRPMQDPGHGVVQLLEMHGCFGCLRCAWLAVVGHLVTDGLTLKRCLPFCPTAFGVVYLGRWRGMQVRLGVCCCHSLLLCSAARTGVAECHAHGCLPLLARTSS